MDGQLTSGPYRATLLWNGLVRAVRSDVPLGRHRRYMKTYDHCFVASDAVDWLHQHLKKNPNFDTDVSRGQSVQLLQKLYKARIFEDVRGQKHNRGDFGDNNRLFGLTLSSPSKTVRTPIALRNNLKLVNVRRSPLIKPAPSQPVKLDFDKMASMPSIPDNTSTLPECHFMSKPLSAQEIEDEWKQMTLQSLQKILGVEGLGDIIDAEHVKGKFIMHNCLYVNKSGVVTNIDSKDQLPHWALSAMKCLAYWPDKIDVNLPNYPGFEKDVFRVVKDYFCELSDPLMTFNMYEVITNVFVKSSNQNEGHKSHVILPNNGQYSNSTPKNINSYKSIENLLMTLTSASPTSTECQDASEGYYSANILDLSPIQPIHNSGWNSNKQHDADTPVTRYETAFGPDNKTVTRVFYADGIATDFNHACGSEAEHTPIETHFEDSPPGEQTTGSFSRKNGLRHSMHNLFNRDKRIKHDKVTSRRQSAGFKLNEENYGCTVGIYSRTVSNHSTKDTPVSRLGPVTRSESYAGGQADKITRRYSSGKPPMYAMPLTYDALNPESFYPISTHTHPIIDASRKFLKRKKSISSASLNQRNSLIESTDSIRVNASSLSDKGQGRQKCDKDVIVGRSLSMSDLAVAPPPVENELQKQCKGLVRESEDSIFEADCTERIIKALQLVCLLLPPANRRRLHLLLRLMSKMSTNEKLVLDEIQPSRILLLETFYRAVLCCQDESEMDDLLVVQLVAFLMDHYMQIFSVPAELKSSVELRVAKLQRTKIRYSADDSGSLHFCKQVSIDEYENQRLSSSQQALSTLLEEIISDNCMALKEKKKRLKQFQKMYPDIYMRRFPCSQSEAELFPPRPKIKQPLLAKPLLKLKGLRL